MSITERLQAMEQLWDALAREPEEMTSPEWHGEVLAERKVRAARGEARMLSLDEVKARLRHSTR